MLDDARLTEIIEPVVTAAGFTLYDAEFRGPSLLVMVDGPNGINLDQVASISRTISRQLDERDPIPGKYTLEVSTPGLERRLRRSDHFQGAIGELVKVKLNPGSPGERRADGELIAADETTATIRVANGDERTVALADIDRARTHFEWGPSPKPGKGTKPGKGSKPGKQKASAKKAQAAADAAAATAASETDGSPTTSPTNSGESAPTDPGQSQP
ncbi:MAG: ribosome maturation factor RimP [Microthrixaceae bacterium]